MMRLILAIFVIALAAGCSSSDGLVELSGKVQVAGEAISQGTITFTPADGTGPSAEATIAGGEYSTRVAPGKKSIKIVGYKKVGEYHIAGPDSPKTDKLEAINERTLEREITAEMTPPVDFDVP
jgi:hypothetical protein